VTKYELDSSSKSLLQEIRVTLRTVRAVKLLNLKVVTKQELSLAKAMFH
jgi:hypothetical protein